LGLGICPLDYLGVVSTYPRLDQKVDLVDFKVQGGGPVPTALVAIARLGGKTGLISKIGNDHEGELIRKELESERVDTRHMLVDKRGRSLQAFVWVDRKSGKRTVVLNNTESSEIKPEEIKASLFRKAKYLLLDGRDREANLRASRLARKYGCQIVIDVGSYRPEVKPLLPFTDYLVIGREFSLEFTGIGKVKRALVDLDRRYRPKAVVITSGERGAIGIIDGSVFRQSGFKVEVVDTTGAGDVFHGAFIYGLTKNWEVPKAVEFACACAAMKCTALGGRTGIPTYRKVLKFLRSRETNFKY
jgi:sulfofructose kinase